MANTGWINKWMFSKLSTDDMIYYYIMERVDGATARIIFNVQLPFITEEMIDMLGWPPSTVAIFDPLIQHLIKVLPRYMQDICNEHNGLYRISHFPYIPKSLKADIVYNTECIGVQNESYRLQIAGCCSDDVGDHFIKCFVRGLKGEWQKGLHFTGVSNPLYDGDDDE